MHQGSIIFLVVSSNCLAFVFGTLAHRLRISPLIGYLLAGVAVGPFTPGYVADQQVAQELAEIGVILLMFGVGLHFSPKDLLSVWALAVPGALAQIIFSAAIGAGLAFAFGWGPGAAIIFGLSLSVASTVVALRSMQDKRQIDTGQGKIAIGWLVVEDIAMVLALVLVPAFTASTGDAKGASSISSPELWSSLLIAIGKVIAFVALMLVVGRRIIPHALHWVAGRGSRELFRLAVLALALGVAFAATTLFGVSFALGAFFAGMVLSGSPLSQRAAEESLPFRDAFAVLFFVSVGMLFDPSIFVRAPIPLLCTVLVVLAANPIAVYVLLRIGRQKPSSAVPVAVSLAQIGEFSFILAGLGVALNVLPSMGRDLILAAAIISILCNPLLGLLADRFGPKPVPGQEEAAKAAEAEIVQTALENHVILVGYGRVGSMVGSGLRERGMPLLVIEERETPSRFAKADGVELLMGNAADPRVLRAANLTSADMLIVAIPQSFEAGQVIKQARQANPDLTIIARTHSDAETIHLQQCGATHTIMGEREIATRMLELSSVTP